MPRFIIKVREVYEHNRRARWQGNHSGFGVLSQSIASGNTAVSAIEFRDIVPGQGQTVEVDADDSEAIQLEVFQVGEG